MCSFWGNLVLIFYLLNWYQDLLWLSWVQFGWRVLFVMQSYSLQEKLLACSLARKVVVVVLVGSMALLSEFLNITILVTRSFSFFIRTCSFIFKTFVVVVVQTWLELLKTLVSFHLKIFWTTLMWIIAFVSLPGRIVVALQRERQVSLLDLLFTDCLMFLFTYDFCVSLAFFFLFWF